MPSANLRPDVRAALIELRLGEAVCAKRMRLSPEHFGEFPDAALQLRIGLAGDDAHATRCSAGAFAVRIGSSRCSARYD